MPSIDVGNVADVESIDLGIGGNTVTKKDGTVIETPGVRVKADTADVVAIIVFLLSAALVLVSVLVKDLRQAVFTGALPSLFAILMTIVGGVEALKIFKD